MWYTIRASLCAAAVIAFGAPIRDRCRRRYAPRSLLLRIRPHAASRNALAALTLQAQLVAPRKQAAFTKKEQDAGMEVVNALQKVPEPEKK